MVLGTEESVNIQLGRGKTARRAYGIDEIALVPGQRTLDPALADTRWTIGGVEREIPIIASAMDGVVDVGMAVRLTQLGALGVLNLEGIQTRYEDPNPILDRIASVGPSEFVGLMQELDAVRATSNTLANVSASDQAAICNDCNVFAGFFIKVIPSSSTI